MNLSDNPQAIDAFITQIVQTDTLAELNAALVAYLEAFNVNAIMAHTLPFGASPITGNWVPYISTYPDEVRRFYRDNRMADLDPCSEAALIDGGPIYYAISSRELANSPLQKKLHDLLLKHKIHTAMGLAVFARPGVAAYYGLGCSATAMMNSTEQQRVQIACTQHFKRYLELSGVMSNKTLTKREQQILIGIVNGKSNAVIAAQLGISEHTVDTYVRRSFEKIGANSRVEAAVKFMGGALAADILSNNDDAVS